MFGLVLAILPARAQESAISEFADIDAMVEAGQAVLLPLGDAFKRSDGNDDMASEEVPPDTAADQTVAEDGEVTTPDSVSDEPGETAAEDVAPEEPAVAVVEPEAPELPEPESEQVAGVDSQEVVESVAEESEITETMTETITEMVDAETGDSVGTTVDVDDGMETESAEIVELPATVEPDSEAAAPVEEELGEGLVDSAELGDTGAETIVVEETVIEDVAIDEPTIDEAATDEAAAEEIDTAAPAVEEPVLEEVVSDESAAEVVVVEMPEVDPVIGDDMTDVGEVVAEEVPGEEIAVAETTIEPAEVEPAAEDQPESIVGATVPLRDAELGNAESIGPYRLWLASYKTVRQAKEGWQQLAMANEDLLGDLTPIIVLKDLGREEGTFFRLQAGPLQSQMSASIRCTELMERNVYCSVLGP